MSVWISAVQGNGGTVSASTIGAVNTFTRAAKANGYWTKLNRVNLFCGDQLAAALVPIKVGGGNATDTNMNFVGGDYTEATGLTGNATTKYLKTGWVPSVSATLADTHISVYNRGTADASLGTGAGGTQDFKLLGPLTGTAYSDQYGTDATGRASVATGTPYGHFVGSRISTSSHVLYKRASSIVSNSTVLTGESLPILEAYIFASNNAGALQFPSAGPISGYSFGSGLSATDVANFNTDMQAFQTTLSRSV